MTVASHRLRFLFIALLLAWLVLLLMPRPAHGGWSADPVEVHATSASCPAVAACDDGHYGAIVAWQENTASGGLLKAQHLLASGDLDPAWSAPTAVSDLDAARSALGAVRDGAGGAYVWWMENAQLFLTRVSATGTVGAGWPARGRSLGTLATKYLRPSVAADGSGGIYLAWITGAPWSMTSVRAIHLGPANTSVGGWPSGTRGLGSTSAFVEYVNAAAIAAAPDGGLWLVLATTDASTPERAAGEVRVARYTSAGLPEPGWSAPGVALALFRGDLLSLQNYWESTPRIGLVSIASDGGSGAYVMRTVVAEPSYRGVQLPEFRLHRVDPVGNAASGWASDGIMVGGLGPYDWSDPGNMASLRALADEKGGVFAGVPEFYTEGISVLDFERFSALGATEGGGISANQLGLECASRGDGGMIAASFNPNGPASSWAPSAYIQVSQTAPGPGYVEWHDQPVMEWYGDVGLTATGDGGAIFVWSQVRERFGIFALRLSPASLVTGVPPTPVVGAPTLRVRFVRGEGVHAVATFAGSPHVTLSLHDLAGRRVSSVTSDATLGADVLLPGTRDLPGGVYFARAIGGGARELHARVIVLP